MTDKLPIDQEFIVAVAGEIIRANPGEPLTLRQVEAVLLALHRLNEFTPPLWQAMSQSPDEGALLRAFRALPAPDRAALLGIAQGYRLRQEQPQ